MRALDADAVECLCKVQVPSFEALFNLPLWCLCSPHASGVTGMALSGEHTLFTCGHDGRALLWDLRVRQAALRSSELAAPLTCLSVKEDDLCVALGAAGRAAAEAGVMVLQGRVAKELATARLEHMLDTQASHSK